MQRSPVPAPRSRHCLPGPRATTEPSARARPPPQCAGIIPAMSDRGLPIVDGAPACPFVAFEDDRDARATAPDHRHRCFAEARPAPRAIAHQEAYCLSSAFPVCPTFQDWARREAAASHSSFQTSSTRIHCASVPLPVYSNGQPTRPAN